LQQRRTREVAAWEIAHLGNFYLGKYPGEVATLEKALGKVHNIYKALQISMGCFLQQ